MSDAVLNTLSTQERTVEQLHQVEQYVLSYAQTLSSRSRTVQMVAKRVLDVSIALAALVLCAPLLVLLILLIRIESRGPAIYRQRRVGKYGRVFTIYKLRTMRTNCGVVLNPDGSTRVLKEDPRLTRSGGPLRRWGLDELPQLFNVLKGDMSLVGPRPDQEFHLQWYQLEDYRKLAMAPGITSLGQVSGRNAISWRERMGWEITYVERFSLWLDVRIMFSTVVVILSGLGAYNDSPGGSAQDEGLRHS